MISDVTVPIDVRVAPWLRSYLTVMVALERLGLALNYDRIARAIDRAITVSTGGSRPRHVFSNRPA